MGKSSWVPSRTQGLSPTYCRWPVLLRLLQVLPSPGWGWRLDRWARSLLVLVPDDDFVGHDSDLAMYLKLWSYVLNYVASANSNLVCNIFIRTLMDVLRMLLVKCVTNDVLCWITTVLVCMSRVGWNPSWFPDYRDYGILSTGIWSLRWLFLYLRSYDLVGSVTAGIRARFDIKHVICVFKTKVFAKILN